MEDNSSEKIQFKKEFQIKTYRPLCKAYHGMTCCGQREHPPKRKTKQT